MPVAFGVSLFLLCVLGVYCSILSVRLKTKDQAILQLLAQQSDHAGPAGASEGEVREKISSLVTECGVWALTPPTEREAARAFFGHETAPSCPDCQEIMIRVSSTPIVYRCLSCRRNSLKRA